MKKPGKTFMKKGDGYSLCKSVCAPILLRPSPQEIVLGRLRGRIRRLFDVGASIRMETRWLDQCVTISPTNITRTPIPNAVFYHYIIHKWTQSLPVRRYTPPNNTQMDAIAPRRRRIPSGAARERSSHVLDGTKLVRKRTCTNYIHIPFFIKVLRSFFKSDRSPSFPVPHSSNIKSPAG